MATHPLSGVTVVELADEQAEYCGLVFAGLGADVIKVEPPSGNSTRNIGPYYHDRVDPEHSLYFWNYNRGKRSVVIDIETAEGQQQLLSLLEHADIFLDSTAPGRLAGTGLEPDALAEKLPRLIHSRMTPFGEKGPWVDYKGSDLVHLALGGPMMNSGYSPQPDGHYDVAPIAPQMWHAYHIAGEQLVMMTLAALVYRNQFGTGQLVSCAVHEAVSKNTELDLMNWVMRRVPLYRQTCAHAMEILSNGTQLAHTKDGRWFITILIGARDRHNLIEFLRKYGMEADLVDEPPAATGASRPIPGSGGTSELADHTLEVFQRWARRFTYDELPWREAQEAGVICVPLRKPEENITDEHWLKRRTFSEVEHEDLGRSFTYVTSKWVSSEHEWKIGRRAPHLDEHRAEVADLLRAAPVPAPAPKRTWHGGRKSVHGKPMVLDGIRVLDFTWFLASAGGTRFLSALGAECIKVEWAAHPDTRMGAMAPVGGRAARARATAPLEGVTDSDMGGQFNNKNPGKRGLSLNVRHPQGLEIARQLVATSDIVAEGFSPGVMDKWGLGYEAMRRIKPDIIYAQQSGMGSAGTYGKFRAVGPIAAGLAGTSEMSGLPSPAMPAGWGYSYLDWIGAYSFGIAMLTAIHQRDMTGKGQWLDASQVETGIFISGTSILDFSANGRDWRRYGNRSPYKPAAPHGAYRCVGEDRWVAIACFTDSEWEALARVAGRPDWLADPRFATLSERLLHQDALDREVTSWTRTQDAFRVMHALQAVGVAAGVCQNAEDRVENDPQLAELNWLTEVTGTKIGTWPIAEVPVKMSATPPHIGGMIDRGAPGYGEDNEYVLGEILGYTTGQIKQFREDGVI
ncbi:CaiB/BaiF CoA transferase family protein [Granulicoccus phenolivorans]|uniref:CaiB/BaiF CoA transferase family protein n=1 Tax=Granulicoccus phenolivorans TaxID=266854 RepID=UPI000414955A|nr:CoA transferase [Granulicoccus phenolivorans]